MSSSAGGNSNQSPSPFELQTLFRPPNPNPNPNFTYAASNPPPNFHHPFLPYPPQNPNPNHGARLMALLNTNPPPHLDSSESMPPPPVTDRAPPILTTPSAPPANMARSATAKVPRGKLIGAGDRAVYDVDLRLAGEMNAPQLEVTPITKYVSDPGLVLGRQIAVNRTYISYGLKQGAIRILNINTALRSLLRGHFQKVTDMAFFAEDVHLLASASIDGKVVVWKVDEGPDEENKPQITGKIVVSVQLGVAGESYHPRICWHSHKQEVLIVAIGNHILKFDMTKLGRNKESYETETLNCPFDKLIDGIQLIGNHDGEITDLSISQWMTTRLASASKDGMVKIWDDRKSVPLVTILPHEGQPVSSVAFLTSPRRPDHIVLITAGPLNREVKMWTSTSDEGWLFPSETEAWKCTQTLELISSSEPRYEAAFFNQVVVLPRAGLIILANAKKNAIYAVHVDYGPCPSSTCMDYIADFTVTMPILSITGTSDNLPDGEQIVQVYCVQTQAIQQYALDLYQCLPPQDNVGLIGRSPSSEGFNIAEQPRVSPKPSLYGSGNEGMPPVTMYDIPRTLSSHISGILERAKTSANNKPSAPPISMSEQLSATSEHQTSKPLDYQAAVKVDSVVTTVPDAPDNSGNGETKVSAPEHDNALASNVMYNLGGGNNPTHLITPSEILSGALSSSDNIIASQNLKGKESNGTKDQDIHNNKVEVKHVDAPSSLIETHVGTEHVDRSLINRGSESNCEKTKDICSSTPGNVVNDEAPKYDTSPTVVSENTSVMLDEEVQGSARDVVENSIEFCGATSQSASGTKGKNQNSKHSPQILFNQSNDLALSKIQSLQDTLNQLVNMQEEFQKQMNSVVCEPVNKEGKRIETALGRSMEKTVKSNNDVLWARFQEELTKRDKAEEHMQQLTNYMTKDLPSMLEKTIKKEISTVAPMLNRAVTPVIEKCISSTLADSFQRGVGDKAVNLLDKSVNSKLEATVGRQIQAQFQTSGKQALQETLRSCLDSSLVPAFEQSCKAMFGQVEATFQKGMTEHTAAAQQQFDSAHSSLAITLRDAIDSASSITKNINNELVDSQRKILSIVTGSTNPTGIQQNNGPTGGLPERALSLQEIEAPLDPTKELSRLISEHKYGEAFTAALQRSDVSIVSWLCTQVELHAICATVPCPLSQGVLLALLQQLACDIGNETTRKTGWITDVAVAINPTEPLIAMHVRPIFEQVYNILNQQRSLPTTTAYEHASIRLLMHVINSLLATCK